MRPRVPPEHDYQPGDVIVSEYADGRPRRFYEVMDPPRTSRGKLRLSPAGCAWILTTWWGHPSTGYRLPKRHRLLPRDEVTSR